MKPLVASEAAVRICPATTPKRRQWRKQQGVVGAALQYLQGRKSRRKYWFSARDPVPQVGPQRGPRVRFLPFKPSGCQKRSPPTPKHCSAQTSRLSQTYGAPPAACRPRQRNAVAARTERHAPGYGANEKTGPLIFERPGGYSAANRGRTGTRSLPRDFKSLVSANSTIAAQKPPRWVCAAAIIILDLPDFVNRWAEADSPARLRLCRRGARHTSGCGTRPPPGSC